VDCLPPADGQWEADPKLDASRGAALAPTGTGTAAAARPSETMVPVVAPLGIAADRRRIARGWVSDQMATMKRSIRKVIRGIRAAAIVLLVGWAVLATLLDLRRGQSVHAGTADMSRSALPGALPIPPIVPPPPELRAAADQALPLPIPPIPTPTPEVLRAEAVARLQAFERALYAQSTN
jgi:hypothetical protein